MKITTTDGSFFCWVLLLGLFGISISLEVLIEDIGQLKGGHPTDVLLGIVAHSHRESLGVHVFLHEFALIEPDTSLCT